jgi:hypothetical protein
MPFPRRLVGNFLDGKGENLSNRRKTGGNFGANFHYNFSKVEKKGGKVSTVPPGEIE